MKTQREFIKELYDNTLYYPNYKVLFMVDNETIIEDFGCTVQEIVRIEIGQYHFIDECVFTEFDDLVEYLTEDEDWTEEEAEVKAKEMMKPAIIVYTSGD